MKIEEYEILGALCSIIQDKYGYRAVYEFGQTVMSSSLYDDVSKARAALLRMLDDLTQVRKTESK